MKFCGVEVSFRRVGKDGAEAEADIAERTKLSNSKEVSASVDSNYGYRERKAKDFTLKTYRKKSPVEEIVFPEPENPDSPWQQQALANLVRKTHEMFEKGWFSVCIPSDAVEQFNVAQNGAARMAYEKLRVLHCVHFDQMNPKLYAQIPALMTCMFTGGDIAPADIWES